MLSNAAKKYHQPLLILASVLAGAVGFLAMARLFNVPVPGPITWGIGAGSAALVVALVIHWTLSLRNGEDVPRGGLAIVAVSAAGFLMAFVLAYQLASYVSLPADLLSFSESPYVNDIIKFRLGEPLYTDPLDNNSYPYNPGSQLLTYGVSALLGRGDSIPFYRAVQLSYVALAAVVAVGVCHLLARRLLAREEYRHRLLWMAAWLPFLFLVALDPRFNLYNHSLHNDGLALLVSVSAFWLIARYSVAPRRWVLVLMVLLPSLGFLVKQNQLMWLGIFPVFLLLSGGLSLRQLALFSASGVALAAAAIGLSYLLWGDNYLYWVFNALGEKEVSLPRSIMHLFQASIYVLMGLFGGWLLVLRNGSREGAALWLAWLMMFGIAAYTSGVGFQANHLGPGVVIATCWFFVSVVKVWPSQEKAGGWRQYRTQELFAVGMVVFVFGALGFVQELREPVPSDFHRYISDIEREFEGLAPDRVLVDTGSWVYLKEGTLMKDRSAPVSLHAGINQPEINQDMLRSTLGRIEQRTYDKILARELDTGGSWYDFQDRGTGITEAIRQNYHEVGRIPAVEGIERWWPIHLVSEIVVLAPAGATNAAVRCPEPPETPAGCGR